MRAGRLDRRVVIEKPTATQDAFGAPIEAWTTLATVWARVQPLRGRELFEAQRENAEVDTRFHLRYRSDITVLHRISYDSAIYDIEAVIEVGRREGLEILGKARVP